VLTLQDVNNHPEGASALDELRKTYDIRELGSGLQLTQRDADLRLFLYEVSDVLGAARRNAQRDWARDQAIVNESRKAASAKRYGPEDIISGAADLPGARRAIAQLEEQILQLRVTSKSMGDQREQWKLRALLAEEKLSKLNYAAPDPSDQRYGALRRFLARRFHPDHAPGTGMEKLIRCEIFKEIWGEVGRIEGR
jgi:hypothetical protein